MLPLYWGTAMDQNLFFRLVWRFNALALAIVLLAAALGLALPFLRWQAAPVVEQVVRQEPAAPSSEKAKYVWRLEFPRPGGKEGLVALVLSQSRDVDVDIIGAIASSSSGKFGVPDKIVNYLFVDAATGSTRWLFPNHEQQIT